MKRGYQLASDLPQTPRPVLLFFTSTFCSKCIKNRQLLVANNLERFITEIDVSRDNALLQELQPNMVPALYLIDEDDRVLYYKEGIISREEVLILKNILNKLEK